MGEKLLRESEFIEELERAGTPLTGRMLRHYVVKKILLAPTKIPGQGNVLFYEKSWVERIKVIHQLVKEGESLDSIKGILASAKAPDSEILDFITAQEYVDLRRHAIKLLRDGQKLNDAAKNSIVSAKSEFRKKFDQKFGKGRYQKMTDDYFAILSKHKRLFPKDWKYEDVLEHFGFEPEKVNFDDPRAIRAFKRDFFKRLVQFLEKHQAEVAEDIEFYKEGVKGYDEMIRRK